MPTSIQEPTSSRERLQALLDKHGLGELKEIQPLKEEASSRRYFRLFLSGDPESVVLCKGLPQPYTDQDGFVELSRFFARRGLSVPEVIASLPKAGALLLTDAGEMDVSEALNRLDPKKDAAERRGLIQKSLQILSFLQGLEAPELVEERLFDETKLKWEMDFLFRATKSIAEFLEIPDPASYEVRRFAYEACRRLDEPAGFVLCHRDFHARNLMLRGNSEIVMIDFQDARMGLPVYDLVSLLYDPYTPLSRQERDWAHALFRKEQPPELEKYDYFFYLQACQRLLKALGSYLYLIFFQGHPGYLKSVPMALRYLEEVAQLGHLPDSVYLFIKEISENMAPRLAEALGKGKLDGKTDGARGAS